MTTDRQPPPAGGSPFDPGAFLSTHPTAVGAVALTAFVLVKTYASAKFSLTTASAILGAAPLSVLLGSLTSYSYFVFPLAAIALVGLALRTWRSNSTHRHLATLVLAVIGTIALLLSPTRYIVVFLVPLAGVLVTLLIYDRISGSRRLPKLGGSASVPTVMLSYSFVAGLMVFLATMTQLWIPIEVITYAPAGGGSQDYIGHVVSADGEWTTVITADSRSVQRLRSASVQSRRVCHFDTQPAGANPLLSDLLGRPYESPNRACLRIADDDAVT